ncbi:hypothetical protein NP233_g5121 [Leucocoprinus birnbaumii]|uniref:Uncharacterized protein n=1 Tax=Leucocoprinus birnbaumii TaxID=56174 RepID=A0AAD5VVS7_9AGAR|nr:hypothetical protein NP233_g5121 [Leucocoprinus birnbaumii]
MVLRRGEDHPKFVEGPDLSSRRLELGHLESLTHVELDTALTGGRGGVALVLGGCLSALPVLSSLILHGDAAKIQCCLSLDNSSIGFTNLQSLSLKYKSPPDPFLGMRPLFSYFASRFPKLHSLSLENVGDDDSNMEAKHTWENILELKPRLMRKLILHNIPLKLGTRGITTLLATWPQLEELSLHPPISSKGVYQAQLIFTHIYFYNLTLRTLGLPLEFSGLKDPLIVSSSVIPKSNSKLTQLNLFKPDNPLLAVKEKLGVVRNLLVFFPKLSVIRGSDTASDLTTDLQAILDTFHDMGLTTLTQSTRK